jgi:hypothetical protein
MYVPVGTDAALMEADVTEGVVGGGVAVAVAAVGGVTSACCECTDGVEEGSWGVRWGVGMRATGGVRECTMGGV